MNILLLCEGDAESWDSWSGISKSLVDQLRLNGHSVDVGDVDIDGPDRVIAAASTFALGRHRWATRYHLGRVPFRRRSLRAHRHIAARANRIDMILQIGATFEPLGRGDIPYCLCCDSNIRVAQEGAASGYSDATSLTDEEAEQVARRERGVYHGAAAIFPLSNRLGNSFVHQFEVPADRVKPIYAGPNFDLSRLPPRAGSWDGPPTILFVGRQFHRKGGDLLVEAHRRIRADIPNARLVIAGLPVGFIDGPGIICLGDLDKNSDDGWAALASAYQSADVFALPTRFEPFGIAFVEAMHFGLPCVGPSAWAVPEIIENAETGFTVPLDDIDLLTGRLLMLLRDRALARALGEAGRQRALRLFTWPQVTHRMEESMGAAVAARAIGASTFAGQA